MRVLSRESTALAYDGVYYQDGQPVAPKRPGKVVIHPGYNDVSEEGEALLATDPNFDRAVDAGIMVVNPEGDAEGRKADESFADEAETVGGVSVDPRARNEGESDKAYKARMKALDAENAKTAEAAAAADKPRVDFLASFNALDETARAASYPTLTDEQKAWVDADKAAA